MASLRSAVCECGRHFETEAPNRRRCYQCSPARMPIGQAPDGASISPLRSVPAQKRPSEIDMTPPPAPEPHVPGKHERIVEAELKRLGALDTVEGVVALGLAQALDDPWLPGAQRTSMAKELKATIDPLRLLVPREADSLDLLEDQAVRKWGAAQ